MPIWWLDMCAFIVPMALGMSLTPFVSQNLGADRLDRIRQSVLLSARFAMLNGVRAYGRGLSTEEILWLSGQTEPVAKPF